MSAPKDQPVLLGDVFTHSREETEWVCTAITKRIAGKSFEWVVTIEPLEQINEL
jgi:hypothetical protein